MALSRARSSGASGRDAQHTAVYAFSFSSEPSCMPLYASLSDTCNPVAVTTPSSADSSAASISASASADTTGDLGLCTSRMNGRPPPSMRTSMSSRPALFSLHPSARIRDETTASSGRLHGTLADRGAVREPRRLRHPARPLQIPTAHVHGLMPRQHATRASRGFGAREGGARSTRLSLHVRRVVRRRCTRRRATATNPRGTRA